MELVLSARRGQPELELAMAPSRPLSFEAQLGNSSVDERCASLVQILDSNAALEPGTARESRESRGPRGQSQQITLSCCAKKWSAFNSELSSHAEAGTVHDAEQNECNLGQKTSDFSTQKTEPPA